MPTRVRIVVPQQFIKKMEGHTEDVAEDSAEQIKESAKELVPVKSGRLKNSIEVTKEGDNYVIGSDLPYAGCVEYGTKDMAPTPYLRPALSEVVNESQ